MCLTFSGSGNESHPKAIRLKRIRRPKVARTRIPRRGKLRGGGWYGKVPVMVTFPNLDAYYGYDSTRSMRFGLPTSYVGSCWKWYSHVGICWVGRLGDLAEGLKDWLRDLRCFFFGKWRRMEGWKEGSSCWLWKLWGKDPYSIEVEVFFSNLISLKGFWCFEILPGLPGIALDAPVLRCGLLSEAEGEVVQARGGVG